MLDLLTLPFVQNALWAAVLTSILCGVVGSLIVVNRLTLMTGGVAHAAYGGVGVAVFLGLPVFPITVLFAVLSGLSMAALSERMPSRSDIIIGVIWAGGMALGIVLVDLTPGYGADLMSYLFGGILAVSHADLWLMGAVVTVCLAIAAYAYRGFAAVAFDADFAVTRGVPVRLLYYVLVVMAAVAVVVMTRVVGLILVVALVSIPTAMAQNRARTLVQMMVMATALSLTFVLSGLTLAMALDLSAGASIIAVAVVTFVLSLLPQSVLWRRCSSAVPR